MAIRMRLSGFLHDRDTESRRYGSSLRQGNPRPLHDH